MALSFENTAPPISVLMPVYNCEKYVGVAIQSILNQTVQDFEFIIIDDASTDGTKKIVESFNDPRIVLICKEKNTGYTNSLNMGLKLAKGKYIARMDGDDISLPFRFEKQLELFKERPDLILCSTNYRFLGSTLESRHPSDPDEVKVSLLSGCYVAHPAVMIRKDVLEKNRITYNAEYEPAEDYNLWVELSRFGLIGNVPEVLLKYRVHNGQVSKTASTKQQKYTNHARLKMLRYLIEPTVLTDREKQIHLALMNGCATKDIDTKTIKGWVDRLKERNLEKSVFKQDTLVKFLDEKLSVYQTDWKKRFANRRWKNLKHKISRVKRNILS